MKDFITLIKEKDQEISKYFERQELKHLEDILLKLEEEHSNLKNNLNKINYLLDLIEHHNLNVVSSTQIKNNKKTDTWLSKVEDGFKKLHFKSSKDLTEDDLNYLQEEKTKLQIEKKQLEKEHHIIHQLIAKTQFYISEIRNAVCKEITKGYDIASVGEKLEEKIGKEIGNGIEYQTGRNKIKSILENIFSINKIQSNELFELLEKSGLVYFKTNYSNVQQVPFYGNLDLFTNTEPSPLNGEWVINS